MGNKMKLNVKNYSLRNFNITTKEQRFMYVLVILTTYIKYISILA